MVDGDGAPKAPPAVIATGRSDGCVSGCEPAPSSGAALSLFSRLTPRIHCCVGLVLGCRPSSTTLN